MGQGGICAVHFHERKRIQPFICHRDQFPTGLPQGWPKPPPAQPLPHWASSDFPPSATSRSAGGFALSLGSGGGRRAASPQNNPLLLGGWRHWAAGTGGGAPLRTPLPITSPWPTHVGANLEHWKLGGREGAGKVFGPQKSPCCRPPNLLGQHTGGSCRSVDDGRGKGRCCRPAHKGSHCPSPKTARKRRQNWGAGALAPSPCEEDRKQAPSPLAAPPRPHRLESSGHSSATPGRQAGRQAGQASGRPCAAGQAREEGARGAADHSPPSGTGHFRMVKIWARSSSSSGRPFCRRCSFRRLSPRWCFMERTCWRRFSLALVE